MVKKKKNNPLAGLTRFNVDPNPITSAHQFSNVELIKDIQRSAPDQDGEFDSEWDKEQYDESVKAQKGIMSGTRSVLDNNQPPVAKTGLEDILHKASGNRRPGGDSPERWLPEHFAYDYDYNYAVTDYSAEAKKQGKAGRFQSWDAGYGDKKKKKPKARQDLEEAEPWRKTGDRSSEPGDPPEFNEWIKTQYDESSKGTPAPSVADIFTPGYKPREGFKLSQSVADMGSKDKPKEPYSTAIPYVSEEQTVKEALAYIKQVSPHDTRGIAETEALLSKIQKTGKVEEPALPQASEKPVAKKKKNEPEYVPSKSEKDFAAGRMPGITGTAEEAASALERTRKASTSKVTGKAKVKLQEEIAAHPMYRGTRQLSDEEVAANEAGDSAPKSTKKGSIRASESVAATAQTPKPKGKGKKAKTPATGSKEAVEAELATGTSAKRDAEFAEKDTREDEVVNTRTKAPQYPYDRLAEPVKRSETVPEYMARIQNVPSTQVVNDDSAIAGKGSTVPTAVPRSDSSGNTIDVSRFEGKPTAAETAAPTTDKPVGYYREKYGELLDSLTPEEKAMSEAGMAAVRDREEAALDADEAERAGKSTPSSMPAPTAGTGMASPTPSWGAPTGTGVASPTATPASPTPATPSAPPAGTGGPRSTPAPAPKVKGPGLGSRIGGFFGGHGGRGGGKAPAPAGPSTSTSSSNTTDINYGAPTFGDQTNLGRNDFGGGGGGAGGGSINMSANSNQANQVQGQNVRIGGSYGGTVGGPVVASTSGRATSNNPRATVLSTGGPASQTQGHPRAQNAKRGGRPTTSNQTPTAPKTKNPRQQKP